MAHKGRLAQQQSTRANASRALEHFRRAVSHIDAGDGKAAGRELDLVLRIVPDNADARCLRGAAANLVGDYERARTELARGLRGFGPPGGDTAVGYNEYAIALRSLERYDEAETVLRELLAVVPTFSTAWHNLALVLQGDRRIDEAVAAARRAVALAPDEAGMSLLLGKLLREQGRLLAAASVLRRAHQLAPSDPTIETTLGNTLFYLSELDESIACFRRAAESLPDSPIMQTNHGTMLAAVGRYADALAAHERALALDPHNPEVVVRRAATLLNLGRTAEGWRAYDGRLGTQPKAVRWRGTPVWDGSALAGKTIVAYREQGIGDEIMFASCYPDLIEAAGQVIIECDPRVEALFTRSFPGAVVAAQTDIGATPDDPKAALPKHPTAHYVIAAGSVAQHVRSNLDAFPDRGAYLSADPARIEHWAARLGAAGASRRVGISWRSMIRTAERRLEYTRLDEWGAIFKIADLEFVLLQYDQCDREVAEAEARFGIKIHRWHDLDLMNDFDDVAALMANLDVVVAPRNAVTMLAGAVGAPTLAIGNVGDWSECGTGQLPWFQSVDCINRNVGDDWNAVLATVAERLRALSLDADPIHRNDRRKATV